MGKNYTNTIKLGQKMYELMKKTNDLSVIEHFYDAFVAMSIIQLPETDPCDGCTFINIEFADVLNIRSINEYGFELNKLSNKINGKYIPLYKTLEKIYNTSDVRQNIYDYSENITFTQLNCVNTIYQQNAFQRFINNPPTKLINNYYDCGIPKKRAITLSLLSAYYSTLILTAILFSAILSFIIIIYIYCKTNNINYLNLKNAKITEK